MSAKVLLDIEAMEHQQKSVLEQVKDNKELLGFIQSGLAENLAVIKANIQYLKAKKQQ